MMQLTEQLNGRARTGSQAARFQSLCCYTKLLASLLPGLGQFQDLSIAVHTMQGLVGIRMCLNTGVTSEL